MAERYTRLFATEKNLYVSGSPLVLSAGALLKDNQTESVLAQLKIKNISNKIIKAVKVSVINRLKAYCWAIGKWYRCRY